MSIKREVKILDRVITFEFNKFAKQANGSVMVTAGDTQVLVTVCGASEPKPGQDFFPLTVDYIEKQYAVGRIPGGFNKREGRPNNMELLNARVIDRPLRPCFPKDFLCETTVTAIVMSYDKVNHPAPLALMGASTALMISDIPFNGPIAALRLGLNNDEYVLDPAADGEMLLDLNIAARPGAVLMVEAGAKFLSEEKMLEAINYAHKLMQPIFDMQLDIQKEIGKTKFPVIATGPSEDLIKSITGDFKDAVTKAFGIKDKKERYSALKEISTQIKEKLNPENDSELSAKLSQAFEEVKYNVMRQSVLTTKKRIDERSLTDIRQISCETSLLKRTHGSAMFTRGETQALVSITLGGSDDSQHIDSILLKPMSSSRFMLHYNFPPFSVGEARSMRPPGRREIGHGALAERALSQVLPSQSDYGYTIRLVSEVLESNGSSSMATVCAGTMALLDAGVPLKEPVAGIAMGLIKEGDDYVILSDILGDEDHLGDMDFKVCGGHDGITALQMDIKIDGLTPNIMAEALEQARSGRRYILGKMTAAIDKPNEISALAPRIFKIKIDESRIRDLIGPGGKNIKLIVADTGVKIDIEDSGIVNIVAPDAESAEHAKSRIRSITTLPEVGHIYLGRVIRTMDFGAFIEIKPGLDGLCHISQLDDRRVERTEDVLSENDQVLVKVIDIDKQGKIKLSRKEAFGQKPTAL